MFLTYKIQDGYVVAITQDKPSIVEPGYAVATSNEFNLGDEFTYLIKVLAVDDNGVATSYTQVKQAPQAQDMLERITKQELGNQNSVGAIAGLMVENKKKDMLMQQLAQSVSQLTIKIQQLEGGVN